MCLNIWSELCRIHSIIIYNEFLIIDYSMISESHPSICLDVVSIKEYGSERENTKVNLYIDIRKTYKKSDRVKFLNGRLIGVRDGTE